MRAKSYKRNDMQKRILLLVFTLLLVSGGEAFAQDAHFSQFYSNPLYLNPAFAGANVCPRVAMNYRYQWPSVKSSYMTYTASYDQHFDKISGGIGVILYGDNAGQATINTYSANVMYSFLVKITRKFHMRLALQAGYQQKSLNWEKCTFPDMIDSKYGFVYATNEQQPADLTAHMFDLSAGFVGYTDYLYFGMAAHHMTMPYEGFATKETRLPVKWTGHIGAYIDLKRKSKKERSFGDVSISPNVIYQHQQNFNYLNTGFYLNFYPFTVGTWLRNNFVKEDPLDALVVMFGIQYDMIRVGYSYDITLGRMANLTGGSHEVSIQLLLRCPEKAKKIKSLNCPSF